MVAWSQTTAVTSRGSAGYRAPVDMASVPAEIRAQAETLLADADRLGEYVKVRTHYVALWMSMSIALLPTAPFTQGYSPVPGFFFC
jgi:hypothetical protein